MCVPGASQAPDSTGVCELVATTTTSAPRTASSADAAARIPNCRAKDAAFRGLHTRTSRNVRTRRSASRWLRAWTPEPRMPSTAASGRASSRVATADTAAVRISVMSRPSIVTSGSPVSGRKSRIIAWWLGMPWLLG